MTSDTDHQEQASGNENPDQDHAALQRRLHNQEVPCLACGYNLRGLSLDSNCPECAQPVRLSLGRKLLAYSDLRYLNTLHNGLRIVILAVMIKIIAMLWVVALQFAKAHYAVLIDMTVPAVFMVVSCTLLAAIGWLIMSTPDPALASRHRHDRSRRVLRVCTAVLIIVSVVWFLHVVMNMRRLSTSIFGPLVLMQLPGLVMAVPALIMFLTSLLYIRWLALRIPSERIAQRAKEYALALPFIYVAFAICILIGPLIAMVLYIVLLIDLRKEINAIYEGKLATSAANPS